MGRGRPVWQPPGHVQVLVASATAPCWHAICCANEQPIRAARARRTTRAETERSLKLGPSGQEGRGPDQGREDAADYDDQASDRPRPRAATPCPRAHDARAVSPRRRDGRPVDKAGRWWSGARRHPTSTLTRGCRGSTRGLYGTTTDLGRGPQEHQRHAEERRDRRSCAIAPGDETRNRPGDGQHVISSVDDELRGFDGHDASCRSATRSSARTFERPLALLSARRTRQGRHVSRWASRLRMALRPVDRVGATAWRPCWRRCPRPAPTPCTRSPRRCPAASRR